VALRRKQQPYASRKTSNIPISPVSRPLCRALHLPTKDYGFTCIYESDGNTSALLVPDGSLESILTTLHLEGMPVTSVAHQKSSCGGPPPSMRMGGGLSCVKIEDIHETGFNICFLVHSPGRYRRTGGAPVSARGSSRNIELRRQTTTS
jgi:hypothetical protein